MATSNGFANFDGYKEISKIEMNVVRNGKIIGPLFLVYRIGNSEGTFDNLTDRNTFYAKTLVTIEVEGKPPSDPILIEGQTRKFLVDRRGTGLFQLKDNAVKTVIPQAIKEARKRKNS